MEPLNPKKEWRNRPPTIWQEEESSRSGDAELLPCQHPECLAAQKRADQARLDKQRRENARVSVAIYSGACLLSGLVYGLLWFAWYLIWGRAR